MSLLQYVEGAGMSTYGTTSDWQREVVGRAANVLRLRNGIDKVCLDKLFSELDEVSKDVAVQALVDDTLFWEKGMVGDEFQDLSL